MSRIIKIRGQLRIENLELAQQAIKHFGNAGVSIIDNQFSFQGYDYYDGINKNREIENIERKYKQLLNEYYEKIEAEKKRIAKEKRLAEEKRLEEIRLIEERIQKIEEERLRVEKEKELRREEKKQQIIENAKKQGYRVQKEISKDNTIKLVLQKRVY